MINILRHCGQKTPAEIRDKVSEMHGKKRKIHKRIKHISMT